MELILECRHYIHRCVCASSAATMDLCMRIFFISPTTFLSSPPPFPPRFALNGSFFPLRLYQGTLSREGSVFQVKFFLLCGTICVCPGGHIHLAHFSFSVLIPSLFFFFFFFPQVTHCSLPGNTPACRTLFCLFFLKHIKKWVLQLKGFYCGGFALMRLPPLFFLKVTKHDQRII